MQYSTSSRRTSHLPAEDDAKTESARQRHTTKRDNDETLCKKTLLVDTSDQSITPELYCSLFLNQLIPSPSCHSLELHPSTNTSRQYHHIQHNTYKNSKTLVYNVTIVIYNIIYIQDIWKNFLHLHSVPESSLDRQSATTFFRPSLYLKVTLYDCRDNNCKDEMVIIYLNNLALLVLDSVI